jgi:hypothetical protein
MKSPRSILKAQQQQQAIVEVEKSPRKRAPKSPTKVKFKQVEVREYGRCHGGSAGIPHQASDDTV